MTDIVYVCKALMILGLHVFHAAVSAPLAQGSHLVLNALQLIV